MTQLTQVINNGKSHQLPESAMGKSVVLFYRGSESRTKIELQGDRHIEITYDGKVHIGSYVSSDAHDLTDLAERLKAIDVQLVLDDPRKRAVHEDQNPAWRGIMARAGYGPQAKEYERDEASGLVYAKDPWGGRLAQADPHFLQEVLDIAQDFIEEALNWAEDNLKRTTIQALNLENDPYAAVQIHQGMNDRRWEVVRVKVGETAEVPWQGSSYFGSGGGWGSTFGYGEFTELSSTNEDNGFVRSGKQLTLFDKGPAIVFTSAGDDLNGGRTFYRKIFIAE